MDIQKINDVTMRHHCSSCGGNSAIIGCGFDISFKFCSSLAIQGNMLSQLSVIMMYVMRYHDVIGNLPSLILHTS